MKIVRKISIICENFRPGQEESTKRSINYWHIKSKAETDDDLAVASGKMGIKCRSTLILMSPIIKSK